jgi:hypothetical protein
MWNDLRVAARQLAKQRTFTLAAAARVIYPESDAPPVIARWRVDLLNRNAAPDRMLVVLAQSGRRHIRVGPSRPYTRPSPTSRITASCSGIRARGAAASVSGVA